MPFKKGHTINLGKKCSEKTKGKISEANKISVKKFYDNGGESWNKGKHTGIKPWLGKRRPDMCGKNNPKWKEKLSKVCIICGKSFKIYPYLFKTRKVCSLKCQLKLASTYQGSNHPQWKGGIIKTKEGYLSIWQPTHPFTSKGRPYIFEHRLIAEKCLKRYLTKWERIHHINGITNDNRPKNLYLFSMAEHAKFHKHPYQLTSNLI